MNGWPAIDEIAKGVQSSKLTAQSLVQQALKNIEQKAEYKTVISTTAERAKARARQIDEQIKKSHKVGRLAGVPFIAKDNFLTLGGETTAASNILKGFAAPYQATAIERLEAAGAICVAKSNLDAFAHGSSTENSDFFTTRNPYDKSRVPGGSSGGSAAAVALEVVPFALGTDTGGSIRLPAAFSGTVGYKPTYGLVSRSGVIAMASSTDVIGPITKTVSDAALVLDVMAGRDELDSTTIDRDKQSYASTNQKPAVRGQKFGVIEEYMTGDVEVGVKQKVEEAVKTLEQAGAQISPISLPSIGLALACYYIICPAEISSNLSRYDGQHFGFTHTGAKTLEQSYTWTRRDGLGKEAKRRIMIGTYVLSSGYYDAYYKRAQIVRTKLINEFAKAFNQVDFLIGPTAPSTAFKIGQNTADPLKMYLTDIMTVAANLVGNPSISLPVGLSDGLPVGLQIMADSGQDKALLTAAQAVERLL